MKLNFNINLKTPIASIKTELVLNCDVTANDLLAFITSKGYNSFEDYLPYLLKGTIIEEDEDIKTELRICRNSDDFSYCFDYDESENNAKETSELKEYLIQKYTPVVNAWVKKQLELKQENDVQSMIRELTY